MESCEAPAGLATRYMSVALQISNHTALTVMRKRGGNSQASVHWRPAGSSVRRIIIIIKKKKKKRRGKRTILGARVE